MKVSMTHNMANYRFIVILRDSKNRTKTKSFVYARGSNRSQGVAKQKALDYMLTLKSTVRNKTTQKNSTGRTGVCYNRVTNGFDVQWTQYYIENNQIVKKVNRVFLPTLSEAVSVREYVEENILYTIDQLNLKQQYVGNRTGYNQNYGDVFPWKENCQHTIYRVDNTSGKTGVRFNGKIQKWVACWYQVFYNNNGTLIKKQINKHFDNYDDAVKKRIWVEENILYTLKHLKLKTDYAYQTQTHNRKKLKRKDLEATM